MADSPRSSRFPWGNGRRKTPQEPVDGNSTRWRGLRRDRRVRALIAGVALSALAVGTASVAADRNPTRTSQPGGSEPVATASEPARPTSTSTAAGPTAEAGTTAPATDAASTTPTEAAPTEPSTGPVQPTAKSGQSTPKSKPGTAVTSTNTDPSYGEAMPVGDLPGWRQVFAEDFTDGDVPRGGFPGPVYGQRWHETYADGTPDTHAKTQEKDARTSGYYPSKVLSIHDGLLDFYLHSENGVSMGAAPSPRFAGATEPPYNSQLYGRYSVRFKGDPLNGYKVAWLLWPVSKQWPQDGEIDFPEGDLSKVIYAALHGVVGGVHTNEVFRPNAPFTSWHVATTEWSPGRIEFFLDGKSIGVATSMVPDKPMRYLLQTESCLTGCPAPETAGHVYVDWVSIWSRSPF